MPSCVKGEGRSSNATGITEYAWAPSRPAALTDAEEILDEDHYGLEDVKDRVLEFLAVHQLRAARRRDAPEAIVVLVRDAETARRMPRELDGVTVEAEVIGEIQAYRGDGAGRGGTGPDRPGPCETPDGLQPASIRVARPHVPAPGPARTKEACRP